MHDLDLKSLRLLVAVCDHQQHQAAAEQEHIEPSAISKRIAQLESALGTPLLVRSPSRRAADAGRAGAARARTHAALHRASASRPTWPPSAAA